MLLCDNHLLLDELVQPIVGLVRLGADLVGGGVKGSGSVIFLWDVGMGGLGLGRATLFGVLVVDEPENL